MIQIIPIEYGKSVLPENMIFLNRNSETLREITFKIYLIIMDNKYILVDAGCETMPGFEMRDFIGTVQALENMNLKPEKITDVIITHSHHDHIECVKYFENAVIHIQQDEYEGGKKYIPNGFKLNIFNDEFLIGENLKIIKIGGHTKGSCIVEIKDDNKKYIVAGDECYIRECLTQKIPTAASSDNKASIEFIEKYSSSEYIVLLCHDK